MRARKSTLRLGQMFTENRFENKRTKSGWKFKTENENMQLIESHRMKKTKLN